MSRKGGGTEGQRWSWILRGNHFDLGVILDNGFDSIVEHAGDGNVHASCFVMMWLASRCSMSRSKMLGLCGVRGVCGV